MKKERCKRNQSLGEEIGNGVTHGVGFLLSVAATVLLYINCDRWQEYLSVTLFSVSMMMLYLSSTLYHSFKAGSVVKRIFKRFDHSSIYLLIDIFYLASAVGIKNVSVVIAPYDMRKGRKPELERSPLKWYPDLCGEIHTVLSRKF